MARPPPSHRQALKTMPKVAKLNLRNNCCRNQGVEALGASAARDGPCARAGGHDRVSSGLLLPVPGEYLKTNSTLVELNINENNLGDEGAKAFAEALKSNVALIDLSLEQNLISDEGAKALAKALKHNAALTILLLSYNSIGDEGAKALANIPKDNLVLTMWAMILAAL